MMIDMQMYDSVCVCVSSLT